MPIPLPIFSKQGLQKNSTKKTAKLAKIAKDKEKIFSIARDIYKQLQELVVYKSPSIRFAEINVLILKKPSRILHCLRELRGFLVYRSCKRYFEKIGNGKGDATGLFHHSQLSVR